VVDPTGVVREVKSVGVVWSSDGSVVSSDESVVSGTVEPDTGMVLLSAEELAVDETGCVTPVDVPVGIAGVDACVPSVVADGVAVVVRKCKLLVDSSVVVLLYRVGRGCGV